MISFLIKASLVLFIFWTFYKLFLERESFFAVNRMYLLGSLFLVFILPFVSLPELIDNQGAVSTFIHKTDAASRSVEALDEILEGENKTNDGTFNAEQEHDRQDTTSSNTASWSYWILLFYGFGVVVLAIHLISQFVNIQRRINRGSQEIQEGKARIIHAKEISEPCSFFNYIFINPKKYDTKTCDQILKHEKVHVNHLHSIDLLLAEIAIIILWFNPMVWFFRKEIEKNIEYQTDDLLLNSTTVLPEEYQMSLLTIATTHKPLSITSNYNQSLIKKRIIMMNTKKSNSSNYMKYAFVIPMIFGMLLCLNQPQLNAQENASKALYEEDNDYDHHNGHSDDLPPLLKAAADGNLLEVRNRIKEGDDVNEVAKGDGTALYLALQHDHWEVAEVLLENGANPNLGSRADGYPIMLAVMTGDPELVQLLVKKGVDVNRDFPGDGNPIIQACKNGDLGMVKTLVDLKADINRGVKGDGNPLIMASRAGQSHVVKYLVGRGANVDYEIRGDETPLIAASEQGHLSTVKFLVESGADVNKSSKDENSMNGKPKVRTPLNMAIYNGHDEVVKYLKSKGAIN